MLIYMAIPYNANIYKILLNSKYFTNKIVFIYEVTYLSTS